jgi:hypothetical protein
VPNITLPEVSFGGIESNIAYQQQAAYQGQVAQVLDRMSRTVFGLAGEMSQRAGLQFAAENPLTGEQLQAMSQGDMSDVKLGTPLNVFNSALRKARALEVSGHAEIEAREKMTGLLQRAETGEIDTQYIRDQMTSIVNGYGEAIAQIEPDAAYKFRASMATAGNQILERAGKIDSQRRMATNFVKLQRDFTNKIKLIETYMSNERPIDEKTGQPIPIENLIDAEVRNFVNNSMALVGADKATQLGQELMGAVNAAKVNVITNAVINNDRQIGGNFLTAVSRLQNGNAGIYSDIYNSMTLQERAAMRNELRSQSMQIEQAQDRARTLGKEQSSVQARQLISDIYTLEQIISSPGPNDDLAALTDQYAQSVRSLNEIAIKTGVVSVEYVRSLPEKAATTGLRNFQIERRLEDEVKNGLVTKEDFWKRSAELDVRPDVANNIFSLFESTAAKEDTEVDRIAHALSKTIRGQMNISPRKQEEIYAFKDAVSDGLAIKIQEWEAGGRVGPMPRKLQIAQELETKQRESRFTASIQFNVDQARREFGPNGTIRKTNINFEMIDLIYDLDGNPIGLDPDFEAALVSQGLTRDHIDIIKQYGFSIERLTRQRNMIR